MDTYFSDAMMLPAKDKSYIVSIMCSEGFFASKSIRSWVSHTVDCMKKNKKQRTLEWYAYLLQNPSQTNQFFNAVLEYMRSNTDKTTKQIKQLIDEAFKPGNPCGSKG